MNGDVTTLPPGSVAFPPTPESPGNTMQITTTTVQPAVTAATSTEYTALSDPVAVGVTATSAGGPGEVLFASTDTGTLGGATYSMQPRPGSNHADSVGSYSMQLAHMTGQGSTLMSGPEGNTQYAMHDGGLNVDSMDYTHTHSAEIQGLDTAMQGSIDTSELSMQGLDGSQISMQTLDGSQIQTLDGATVSMQGIDASTPSGTLLLSEGDYGTQLIPAEHLIYTTSPMSEAGHQVPSMYPGGETSAVQSVSRQAGHMTQNGGTGSGGGGAPTQDELELLYQSASDMSGRTIL